MGGIFGRSSRIVTPPHPLQSAYSSPNVIRHSRSTDAHDRKPFERALTAEGAHHDIDISDDMVASPTQISGEVVARHWPGNTGPLPRSRQHETAGRQKQETEPRSHQHQLRHAGVERARTLPLQGEHVRGHAHDPLTDTLFLDIGTGPSDDEEAAEGGKPLCISESPTAVDTNVYEEAYKQEMHRILEKRGKSATMYLTRRVEHHDEIRQHENVIGQRKLTGSSTKGASGGGLGGLAGLVARAKANAGKDTDAEDGNDAGSSP